MWGKQSKFWHSLRPLQEFCVHTFLVIGVHDICQSDVYTMVAQHKFLAKASYPHFSQGYCIGRDRFIPDENI